MRRLEPGYSSITAGSNLTSAVWACAQEESFKVLRGKFGYFWENETKHAEVGQALSIPAGVKHSFFNADPEQPLEFEVTLKPAVRVASAVFVSMTPRLGICCTLRMVALPSILQRHYAIDCANCGAAGSVRGVHTQLLVSHAPPVA